MGTFRKLALIGGVVVALLLVAIIALPYFFKDTITARVKAEINQRVNATVNFSDLSLTLIRSFPNLTVSIQDLSVVGAGEFAGQPLLNTKSLNLTLSIWDLMGGKRTTITSINLDRPVVNVIVLKNGKANYDIAKPAPAGAAAPASEPSSFSMAIKSYAITNGRVAYDDRKSGLKASMDHLNHRGTGDFTSDLFALLTSTTADATNVSYGGIRYLTDARLSLDSDLQVDVPKMKFTAKDTRLVVNDLGLGVDGTVAMPGKNVDVDVTWAVRKNDFKTFMSLVPGVYRTGFDGVKADGVLDMKGFVKGRYDGTRIPGFGVTLSVKNGSFQYPTLPAAITNANIDLGINNPDGVPDHTVVDLKQLHAELGGEPIDARLHLATPISDPQIDAAAKGTVNLGNVKRYIPLDPGTDLSGVVAADLIMKGRYASVAAKQIDKLQAAGTVALTDVSYKSEGVPPSVIRKMLLNFTPATATVSAFNAQVGKSEITATGSLDNLPAYYFKNEPLSGHLTVSSPSLDLNEFVTAPAAAPGATPAASTKGAPASGPIALPANVNLSAQATIGQVLYQNMTLSNVKGAVTLKDQVLDMSGLTFTMLNGAVTMSGQYATSNPARPQFGYTMSLGGLDIQQTVKTFDTVRSFAPIAERAKGAFAAELSVTGAMDEKNQPLLNTINGRGKLTTAGVTVANFEPLNKIADALHMGDFREIAVPKTVIQFNIKDGRVQIDPFDTSLQGTSAKISGTTGLDQSLDLKIELAVPRSRIPAPAISTFAGLLGKVGNLTGSAVQLPETMKINLGVGGTVPNPTVRLALAGGANSLGASIVDQAKDKLQDVAKEKLQGALKDKVPDKAADLVAPNKAKEEAAAAAAKLIAEAEGQAQQLRDTAKASADKLKQEGYSAADKLIADAGGNPLKKLAAQRAASALRKETDQKAQKIVDEGNGNADKLVADARRKAGGGT